MQVSFGVKFIVLSLCVGLGFAYNCYMCQDVMGRNLACETNVETVLQPLCVESFACIKYIWTSNGSSEVYRACAPKSKCGELKATETESYVLAFCETCDEDLCNSGFTPGYMASLILSGLLYILARAV